MTDRHDIAVAVVECNDRYLVGIRDERAVLAGHDEFPGGKVKTGETPAETARRECLEETGLSIEVEDLIVPVVEHTYAHGQLRLHFFSARVSNETDATPKPPFRWVDASELSQLRFPEANQVVIETLLSHRRDARRHEQTS
ncbi:MAG: NUDIX domain-containing protein [Planctomycetia bacterium]|nr:NUDIX domain-containing protein [Planctomycetia bacterium]